MANANRKVGRDRLLLYAQTGVLLWTTAPAPHHQGIITDQGFVTGNQGYGAFESLLYAPDGRLLQRWPSHGHFVLDDAGKLRGPELDNSSRHRQFSVLESDGSVAAGPALSAYYTIYPVIAQAGEAVFWRNGELLLVTKQLEKQGLFAAADPASGYVSGRMLLLGAGTLVMGHGNQIWIMETDLGPLGRSVWPCAGANSRNNPAYPAI